MTPAETAALRACVLKGVPNTPNTGESGSKICTLGMGWPLDHAGLSDGERIPIERKFLWEEAAWRGLDRWVPTPLDEARPYGGGDVIVNDLGQPIKPTVADQQHFRLLPHLRIALGSPVASHRQVATTMTLNLLRWLATQEPQWNSPRALGWAALAYAQALEAAPVGHPFVPELVRLLTEIMEGVVARMSPSGAPAPWLVLNDEQRDDKDHGEMPVCGWQTWVLVVGACAAVDALKRHTAAGEWPKAATVAVAVALKGAEIIEWATRPDGTVVGDWSEAGETFTKGQVMAPFAWAAAAALERLYAEPVGSDALLAQRRAWKPDNASQLHWGIRLTLGRAARWA